MAIVRSSMSFSPKNGPCIGTPPLHTSVKWSLSMRGHGLGVGNGQMSFISKLLTLTLTLLSNLDDSGSNHDSLIEVVMIIHKKDLN